MFRRGMLVLLIGVMMAACAAPPAVAPVRPEGQELVLWHSYEGALRDALLAQVDEFNAANPWRIVVVPEYHGNSQQLGVELQAAVKAGAALRSGR